MMAICANPASPLGENDFFRNQTGKLGCYHIRHFSLLSYLPSAGNPSTQPPIRRLALPLIRSIIQPNNRPHRRRTIVREADVVANHSQTIPHLQPTFSASSIHLSSTSTLRPTSTSRLITVHPQIPAPATMHRLCIRHLISKRHTILNRIKYSNHF